MALWFAMVPLGLAIVAVGVLKAPDGDPASGVIGQIRWMVRDQPVPAGIVLFTLFEMLLYHFRHQLPLAGASGIGGRSDLPKELRPQFEQATGLLEEAHRIIDKNQRAVERNVPSAARQEIADALDALEAEMHQQPLVEQGFLEAFERASWLVDRHLGRWRKSEIREYTESIAIAVAVALLLRAFVVEAFKIPSGSMLPTLQIQDHIFVNKLAYGPIVPFSHTRLFSRLPPKRGDVMVFITPDPSPANEGQDFIKRVIALEGDTLAVEGGHPILNGWRVPSCRVGEYDFREGTEPTPKRGELWVEFLGEQSYLTLFEDDRFDGRQGPYRVAPGEVWVLGDNRNNSSDSRAWFGGRGGGVPFANMKGRAMFVWLSFAVDGSIGWDRLLTDVMGHPRLPKGAPLALLDGIDDCLAKRPSVAETTPPAATGR